MTVYRLPWTSDPCCYICTSCGHKVCADQHPSPGEPHTCADCTPDLGGDAA